jgi:hypothetical protein
MRYRFELVTRQGQTIAEWTMPAYGKTPTAFLRSDEAAVNLAAVMALRDAGANFAVTFQRIPEVAAWLGGPDDPGSAGARSAGDLDGESATKSRSQTAPTDGAKVGADDA